MPVLLHEINKIDPRDADVDVIFVHGLGGDHCDTWRIDKDRFWPEWLANDIPRSRLFSVEYPSSATNWSSSSSNMGLLDRSKNILDYLSLRGIGDRPVIFITHSLGGVLVKQLLHTASTMNIDKWNSIVSSTRGIVFMATPHFGSGLANILMHFYPISRPSTITKDLVAKNVFLQNLGDWFRQNIVKLNINVASYYETEPTKGAIVVDSMSANPGVIGCVPVGVDSNHINICKPSDKDSLVYRGVKFFIDEIISSGKPKRIPIQTYLVPGYCDYFRMLKEAIDKNSNWNSCRPIQNDVTRLKYGLERSPMNPSNGHVFFIDISSHEPEILEFLSITRSFGRALPLKPIFIFYSNEKDLKGFMDRLDQMARKQLSRYYVINKTDSHDDLESRLSVMYDRILSEWKSNPRSSASML
jgi:pimeloyl-ACP methyl ester carboxylesterase